MAGYIEVEYERVEDLVGSAKVHTRQLYRVRPGTGVRDTLWCFQIHDGLVILMIARALPEEIDQHTGDLSVIPASFEWVSQ